jgi:hypothetical protein
MSASGTALLVIDAQESFRQRPYWNEEKVPLFVTRLQALIDGARKRGIPVVQIFHVEESGVFSVASGYVKTLAGLSIQPEATFQKRSHSALIGSGLDVWLVQHGIRRVIVSGSRLVVILICGEQPRIRRRGQSTIINSHLQAVFALNDAEGIDEIPMSLRSNTLPLNNPQAIRT